MADFWPVRTTPKPTKNPLFTCKQHNEFSTIARTRSRKSVARYYIPPPELSLAEGQAKTPQQAAIIAAKAFVQELGIPIPKSIIRKVTGVSECSQIYILALYQVRTRYNWVDLGPDP